MRNILAALFFCQAWVGISSFRLADPAKQEELTNEWKKGQFFNPYTVVKRFICLKKSHYIITESHHFLKPNNAARNSDLWYFLVHLHSSSPSDEFAVYLEEYLLHLSDQSNILKMSTNLFFPPLLSY